MTTPQDIDLKGLEEYNAEFEWFDKPALKQFLSDKLNRIEKEIDNNIAIRNVLPPRQKDKDEIFGLKFAKNIIRKEFTEGKQ